MSPKNPKSMSQTDPWVVHKFGGSSVANADCFRRVAAILEAIPGKRLAVVLSACRGVTDALLRLIALAERQNDNLKAEIGELRARHGARVSGLQVCRATQEVTMNRRTRSRSLLPAATSHGIGSDSQRPFAIVIVGGLMAALLMSIFLLPTLYVWTAGPNDVLPEANLSEDV